MAQEPGKPVAPPPSREDVRERLEGLARRLEEHRNVVSDHVDNMRAAKGDLATEQPDKHKIRRDLRDISETIKSANELSTIAEGLDVAVAAL